MDLKEYIKSYLGNLDPDLDVRDNSPYSDLFIIPQVYLGAAFYEALSRLTSGAAPVGTASTFTSEELELLAKKAFVRRVPAKRAYGKIRIYMSQLTDLDLTNVVFTTKEGVTIHPSGGKHYSASELIQTNYGYKVEIIGYTDTGKNIDANAINDATLTGWARLENDAFADGSAGTTDSQLLELYYNSYIYQDNFLYERSIKNLITKLYPDISKIYVVGKGDTEMQRDLITNITSAYGITSIQQNRPNDIDVTFTYTPETTLVVGDAVPPFPITLTDAELDAISLSSDYKSYEFVKGKYATLAHAIFTEYTGMEYNVDGTINAAPSPAVVKNNISGTSPVQLSGDSKSSDYIVSDSLPISSVDSKTLVFSADVTKIGGRFGYFMLTKVGANAPHYYEGLGVAFKKSESTDDYNIFLINRMDSGYGDISIGDVSLNVGDNLASDTTSAANSFGRPYLAAGHLDIAEGQTLTLYLDIIQNATNNTYSLKLSVDGTTDLLAYNNLEDTTVSNYTQIQFGVSDYKDDALNPNLSAEYDITLSDMGVNVYNGSGYLAFSYAVNFEDIPSASNDFYDHIHIGMLINGSLPVDTSPGGTYYYPSLYMLDASGNIVYLSDASITAEQNQAAAQISIDYTDLGTKFYDAASAGNTLTFILSFNHYPNIDVDLLYTVLTRKALHAGNMIDVILSAEPVLVQNSVTTDSNGVIEIGGTGLTSPPILKLVSVESSGVPVESAEIALKAGATAADSVYRYSTREGEYYELATGAGSTDVTVTYYTNPYVSLVQTLASDDYYKDPVQSVLIKAGIPISINRLEVSANIGYIPENALSDLRDYVINNPDALVVNDIERVFLNDGARSVSITSLQYTIYYPDQNLSGTITTIPSTIDTKSIDDSYDGLLYKNTKAFVLYDTDFVLTVNGVDYANG